MEHLHIKMSYSYSYPVYPARLHPHQHANPVHAVKYPVTGSCTVENVGATFYHILNIDGVA